MTVTTGPRGLGVLNEASNKIGVQNGVTLGRHRRVGPIRARCNGFGSRRQMNFEGENSRAGGLKSVLKVEKRSAYCENTILLKSR